MSGTTANAIQDESSIGRITAIAIGRNEGDRLVRCISSLTGAEAVGRVLYVDSGSSDGSQQRARALGAEVVALDMTRPFTAARARNAGLRAADDPLQPELIQFVDGDCELAPGWIEVALAALDADPGLGIVAGRRRERFPAASIYNAICEGEWNTPVGAARAVGGDMLARRVALSQAGGFDDALIAGEEPEMCLRLRQAGWRIARIDAEMTLHDADMQHLSQWWRRNRRAGHAFAEVSWLHRMNDERIWQHETRRAVVWAAVPALALIGALLSPWALALLALLPAQAARIALRDPDPRWRWPRAGLTVLGKLPEAAGVIEFHLRRLRGQRRATLIEYK